MGLGYHTAPDLSEAASASGREGFFRCLRWLISVPMGSASGFREVFPSSGIVHTITEAISPPTMSSFTRRSVGLLSQKLPRAKDCVVESLHDPQPVAENRNLRVNAFGRKDTMQCSLKASRVVSGARAHRLAVYGDI